MRTEEITDFLTAHKGEMAQRFGVIKIGLFGMVRIFHRPHPSPDTDKGAISSIRRWLEENGVKP